MGVDLRFNIGLSFCIMRNHMVQWINIPDKFLNSASVSYCGFSVLFASTIFINKYVLSVLMFTYPTVFQGWQTLIAVVILKILSVKKKLDVPSWSNAVAWSLLPHCLYFLGAIVAGSKALASLPIPVFVSVCNLPSACIFLLDYFASLDYAVEAGLIQITASIISLGAAISLILLDISLPFADSGYSWLMAHVFFQTAQKLHSRLTDPQYSEVDKLYYSNIFSVVILAPASLYLEEAFLALHFQHRHQIHFYLGCLLSGILGITLQLWSAKLSSNTNSQQIHAFARILTCVTAVLLFNSDMTFVVWGFAMMNLISTILIPSELKTTEKYEETLNV